MDVNPQSRPLPLHHQVCTLESRTIYRQSKPPWSRSSFGRPAYHLGHRHARTRERRRSKGIPTGFYSGSDLQTINSSFGTSRNSRTRALSMPFFSIPTFYPGSQQGVHSECQFQSHAAHTATSAPQQASQPGPHELGRGRPSQPWSKSHRARNLTERLDSRTNKQRAKLTGRQRCGREGSHASVPAVESGEIEKVQQKSMQMQKEKRWVQGGEQGRERERERLVSGHKGSPQLTLRGSGTNGRVGGSVWGSDNPPGRESTMDTCQWVGPSTFTPAFRFPAAPRCCLWLISLVKQSLIIG